MIKAEGDLEKKTKDIILSSSTDQKSPRFYRYCGLKLLKDAIFGVNC